MIGFFVGLFVGVFIGVLVMCCCFVASKADEEIERMESLHTNDKEDS